MICAQECSAHAMALKPFFATLLENTQLRNFGTLCSLLKTAPPTESERLPRKKQFSNFVLAKRADTAPPACPARLLSKLHCTAASGSEELSIMTCSRSCSMAV